MGKIKKLFNTKIVLFIVAVLFFLKSAASEEVLPKKPSYLRVPAGQSKTYSRIVDMRRDLSNKRLFTGTYKVAMDTSYRVIIPSMLRKQFSGNKVMLQFVNKDLIQILEYEQWLKAVTAQAPSDPAQLAAYNHRIYAFVYLAEVDEHNRVRIPQDLHAQTNFKAGSDVIITGVGGSIELMPKETFVYPEVYEIPVLVIDSPLGPFTGTYNVAMDTNYRVIIPSMLRKQFSGNKVMLQFVNKDLIQILEYEQWLKAVTAQAPSDPAQLAAYNHRIYAFVYLAEVDEHNRVRIPQDLHAQTNFKAGSDVIITGVGGSIEIKPKSPLSITPASIRTGI